MVVEETPGYKKTSIKTMFYSYHMEQKIFIEDVITIIYTLEKKFLVVAAFKGL